MTQGRIAPHEGRELEYVFLGIKPFATLDRNKQPKLYAQALARVNVISVEQQDNDLISVTLKGNEDYHALFRLLSTERSSVIVRSEHEKHRLLGRLFGYTEEDIDTFISEDLACACGQCNWNE